MTGEDEPAGSPSAASDIPPQPPPPPAPGPPRLVFDGAFVGPMLPPWFVDGRPTALPVSEDVLAIPLGTRRLVGKALDLLTRPDSGLRSASFYIGFILLVTVAPVVILVGIAVTTDTHLFQPYGPRGSSPFDGPVILAAFVAIAGYWVAAVESRVLATAVIGGRAEGRPLRLRESIGLTRRRFWQVLGAMVGIGVITGLIGGLIGLPVELALGNVQAINYGLSLVIGTLVSAPFVYTPAGIVLGEADALEAIKRSFGLARSRKRLALVVALFGILSQFIVLFGVSIGGDVVYRVIDGAGLIDSFPVALVIPLSAALVFALGTLLFLVEAIAAAPAVFAFEALTHYTHGLESGREHPAAGTSIWSPWMTPGLLIGAVLAVLALAAGLAGLAGTPV